MRVRDAMYLEPTGMSLPYFLKKTILTIFKGIVPTNGDFRSHREGSLAGDKWGAASRAQGNSFLLFIIARLTTLLDHKHTPS